MVQNIMREVFFSLAEIRAGDGDGIIFLNLCTNTAYKTLNKCT